MEFGTKLKELRATKGVSQAKLAADIHISRSAVAKWENGLGLPNDESLRMLSEYFGIPVSDLIPDKTNAETIVTKNKTINQQKKAIIGLSIGCAAILFILAFRHARKFCVSEFRQTQEYHVYNVHDWGLFPLSTAFPGGWDGMRAACGVNAVPASREA